jgi:hypothetical protein
MTTNGRLLLVVGGLVIALLSAVAWTCIAVHRVRVKGAMYLGAVAPLHIGVTNDIVVAKLRDAGIPLNLDGDCLHECTITVILSSNWEHTLHLAHSTGVISRLDFQDHKLVSKFTTMGWSTCCMVAVNETESMISETTYNMDAAGRPLKIFVHLSPSDFTAYRKQAYTFDLGCIGSIRNCKTDEYLPYFNELVRPITR